MRRRIIPGVAGPVLRVPNQVIVLGYRAARERYFRSGDDEDEECEETLRDEG